MGRIAAERHDGLVEALQPEGRIGTPSLRAPAPRTASNRVPEAWLTTRRRPRPVGVDRAEAGGEPRDPPGGVGRSVHGVDHHDQAVVGVPATGLLRQHADTRPVEDGERGGVGRQVVPVLVGLGAGQSPVVELAERLGDAVAVACSTSSRVASSMRPTLPEAPGPSPRPPGPAGRVDRLT